MDKQLKEKWLEALRSGEYTQTHGEIKRVIGGDAKHCCLGVLLEVSDEYHIQLQRVTGNTFSGNAALSNGDRVSWSKACTNLIGDKSIMEKLWRENDDSFDSENPDYRNVIPIIENIS